MMGQHQLLCRGQKGKSYLGVVVSFSALERPLVVYEFTRNTIVESKRNKEGDGLIKRLYSTSVYAALRFYSLNWALI